RSASRSRASLPATPAYPARRRPPQAQPTRRSQPGRAGRPCAHRALCAAAHDRQRRRAPHHREFRRMPAHIAARDPGPSLPVRVLRNESGSLASPAQPPSSVTPIPVTSTGNPEVLGKRPDASVFNGDLADKGESGAYRKPRGGVEPLAAQLVTAVTT